MHISVIKFTGMLCSICLCNCSHHQFKSDYLSLIDCPHCVSQRFRSELFPLWCCLVFRNLCIGFYGEEISLVCQWQKTALATWRRLQYRCCLTACQWQTGEAGKRNGCHLCSSQKRRVGQADKQYTEMFCLICTLQQPYFCNNFSMFPTTSEMFTFYVA